MREIKFRACEHLDFDGNYTAKKKAISAQGTTKVCWNRSVIDDSYPRLVQFCKRRGRLNNPECCLCESDKMCSDYNEIEHTVTNVED